MHISFKNVAITLAVVAAMPLAAQQRDKSSAQAPTAATSAPQGKVNMAAFRKIMEGMFHPFQNLASPGPIKNSFLPSPREPSLQFQPAGAHATIPSRSFSFLGVKIPTPIIEKTDCGKVKVFKVFHLGIDHPK